jgi:hypothetical protein
MIVSEHPKFIFIHIHKVAGTSITKALVPYAGKAWKTAAVWALESLGFTRGMNRVLSHPYPPHIRAKDLAERMGRQHFDSYYSFAFVRNPWDWQVSQFTYMRKDPDQFRGTVGSSFQTFDDYIRWRCSHEVVLQRDFVFSETGEQLVDFVGKLENLESDFRIIEERLGISVKIPRINVSRSTPYQEYYTRKTVELVHRAFQPDIELFGYDFK